jgi:hypothetical protein
LKYFQIKEWELHNFEEVIVVAISAGKKTEGKSCWQTRDITWVGDVAGPNKVSDNRNPDREQLQERFDWLGI